MNTKEDSERKSKNYKKDVASTRLEREQRKNGERKNSKKDSERKSERDSERKSESDEKEKNDAKAGGRD